jgi:DNA-binding Lrp family transcriptional regulator
MNKRGEPDTIDWKILREIQRDGRVSNVELAGRVGLSPPPTLRRVQALEQAGLIIGYRAQLNREKLDYSVKMFVLVGLKSQARPEMEAFERQAKAWPIVRECYGVQGGADYVLVCVARDLQAVQSFVNGALLKAPNVDSVRTSLILSDVKTDPEIPLP